MYNSNIPSGTEVPSTAKLIKSTILAAVAAGILLVTVVMPAEYGIDPSGSGKVLGLTRMGEIKTSLAKEAEDDKALDQQAVEAAEIPEPQQIASAEIQAEPPQEQAVETQSHEMTFTLASDQGTEVKVTMKEGATVNYVWETDGGKANFDIHGDSKELDIDYHNYSKGSDVKSEGSLVAAFDGGHGWFWRNRTKAPLTITLKTSGEYSSIKRY